MATGVHQIDQMNRACEIDVYKQWARAATGQGFLANVQRKYNVATTYKRATGDGRIHRIHWSPMAS